MSFSGLGEKIRTSGLLNPIQARYQTAPHPVTFAPEAASRLGTLAIISKEHVLVNTKIGNIFVFLLGLAQKTVSVTKRCYLLAFLTDEGSFRGSAFWSVRRVVALDGDVCQAENFEREVVGVAFTENHTGYARIDDHFGAYNAGLVGAVKGSSVNADAELCGLDDGVLLGVNAVAELVLGAGGYAELSPQALLLVNAAWYTGGRTVVARGEDALVFHYYGADLAPLLIAA